MSQDYYSIVEMGFTGAAVLGFALWQLRSVNRDIRADRAKRLDESAERARHPVGEHPLDDR